MSYLMSYNTWYGALRTVQCLLMLKRFHDAGYDPVKATENFYLHAASQYGYSNIGEPLDLFGEMIKQIFPSADILGNYDDYGDHEKKINILNDMNLPAEIWKKYKLQHLIDFDYFSIIHIKDDFRDIDFHFRKEYPRTDNHYFETDEESAPILHFRNEREDELIIILDYNYYYPDPDTILQFCLWIKGQMKEAKQNEVGIRN